MLFMLIISVTVLQFIYFYSRLDASGIMLTEDEAVKKRWLEYIEILYDKAGKPVKKQ